MVYWKGQLTATTGSGIRYRTLSSFFYMIRGVSRFGANGPAHTCGIVTKRAEGCISLFFSCFGDLPRITGLWSSYTVSMIMCGQNLELSVVLPDVVLDNLANNPDFILILLQRCQGFFNIGSCRAMSMD